MQGRYDDVGKFSEMWLQKKADTHRALSAVAPDSCPAFLSTKVHEGHEGGMRWS